MVRLDSVRGADAELGRSDTGVSMQVAALREDRAILVASRRHRYRSGEIITVAAANSQLAVVVSTPDLLRHQQWMLGPSASSGDGEVATMLRGLAIPEWE